MSLVEEKGASPKQQPQPPRSSILRRPLGCGGPRRPNSWRHPGGTVSETEECELSEAEDGVGDLAEAAAAAESGTRSESS